MTSTTDTQPATFTPGADKSSRKGKIVLKGQDLQERKFARKMIMPALAAAILITQVPFLITIYYSFQNWNLARPEERSFAGFDNYVAVIAQRGVPPLDVGHHPDRRRFGDPVPGAGTAAGDPAGP